MSQTRSEVLSLLKQFDQEFAVFEGLEESFLLHLVQDNLVQGAASQIDWQRLSKATFCLSDCYIAARKGVLNDVPHTFLQQAKANYLHQVATNESRIEQIQGLARLFEDGGVKVLFVKGAAELSYSPDDVDFLGRRYMCDIDLLCAIEDLHHVDELVRSAGYKLWDHRLKHWTREEVCQFTLNSYSHYIYNAYSKTYMELHGHVAVGPNRASYPLNFERLLLEQGCQVNVRGVNVWVPKPEHLLVYSLCHAASKNNNQELIYLDRFYLDEFAQTDCAVSPAVVINRRLDMSQLQFLFQLRNLLCRFDGSLNFSEIGTLLAQVAEQELNAMYAAVGSFIFKERFPVVPVSSLELIQMSRQRYVSRFILPLLAERIESIILSRLETLTTDFVQQQVEKITVTVERKVIHEVTERIVSRAKSFVSKRMKRVWPKPLHKILK